MSSGVGRRGGCLLAVFSALLGLIGCRKAPPPAPTVADLKFPVLLVTEQVSLKECPAVDDLTNLHSNYLDLSQGERRFVIDSGLRVFQVLNVRSAKSPYLRMITGPGRTAVLFDLSEVTGGIVEAQHLLISCKYLTSDSDKSAQAKQAIQRASTMDEILSAIHAAQ